MEYYNNLIDELILHGKTMQLLLCRSKTEVLTREPQYGVWPPVFTKQDMCRIIRAGLAHKIKVCTALVDVHRKILYSTKYDIFLLTLPLQST